MGQNKRILIIDDDIDLLEQLSMMLSGEGYEIETAEGQAEGEEAILATRPDLVVVDLMMENMDSGFVLCHSCKSLYPDVPVIVLTAVTSATGIEFSADTQEERSWIKADAFLDKPVRPETIKHEIRKLLQT